MSGYFQNEQYYRHLREEILKLFAPPANLKEQIKQKYPILYGDFFTVGVQIRDYKTEFPTGKYHPTHGRTYYEKAVCCFPRDAVFVVSTNNIKFAKECMDGLCEHIIYLNSGDYIEDFYTLSKCKSFIISNSSFGWWAAWLSDSSDKTVIAPRPWHSLPYDDQMASEIVSEEWVTIDD